MSGLDGSASSRNPQQRARPASTAVAFVKQLQEPLGSPASTSAASDSSSCMTSPSFSFSLPVELPVPAEADGRKSSAGSSDLSDDAPVQQLPVSSMHKSHGPVEIPPLELNKPRQQVANGWEGDATMAMDSPMNSNQPLSFGGVLSPRQQSGKRYHGGYLQHRVPVAAGLLKSWKRKYFRLRGHGLVCYKTLDAATPLFEVHFTTHSVLQLDKLRGDRTASSGSIDVRRTSSAGAQQRSPKAGGAAIDPSKKMQQQSSWAKRTASSSGPLVLILKHVEVTGPPSIKNVGLPVFLKAENETDHAAWVECLRFAIDARKRTLTQALLREGEPDGEVTLSPAEASPSNSSSLDASPPSQGDHDGEMAIKSPRRRRRSSASEVAQTPSVEASGPMAPRATSSVKDSALDAVEPEDYETFRSRYLLMKEIGEGSFSIVHRAVNRLTGRLCAVKCCKHSPALDEEVRLLRMLAHPNVVGLEGVYRQDQSLHYVVMDYLKDGDLCDLLIERQRLPEPEARRIIRQVVEGLAYLHRHCVLHRDIKPENILIHGSMVKIADFGLAKQLAQPSTMLKRSCGTLEYAAPELLCGRPYGLKSDVFSLGVVLYVLLFGAFPFSVESAAALQCMDRFPTGVDVRDMSCLSRDNMQWHMVSHQAQDVLLQMLRPNDSDRISAEDLLGHPWFDEVDEDMTGPLSSRDCRSIVEDPERARIEDCEAMGFAELLSRGFQVVKYGYKESTTPHSTALALDFADECITWTSRRNPMITRVTSSSSGSGAATGKQRRAILLREIQEVREGHTTDAFLLPALKGTRSVPPAELCLSIVCLWRTLDIVVEVSSQREFLVRSLRRLLPSVPRQ
ncbi:hypothetical protein BBJ28_00014269 [Nothophytophthora sp. Chile5]|nr:hypothetical protein BBJ28_00014269 [Nothophytophthora sp. Chile5]